MSLDSKQLLHFVVRPVLAHLDLPGGEAAERLVLATAAQESDLRYIDQMDRGGQVKPGPALGLWQMERATFDDLWDRYLPARPALQAKVLDFAVAMHGIWDEWQQLAGNLYLSCAMCRILYYARPFKLRGDESAAELWPVYKRFYNSELGAATAEQFHRAYRKRVAPLYRPIRSQDRAAHAGPLRAAESARNSDSYSAHRSIPSAPQALARRRHPSSRLPR